MAAVATQSQTITANELIGKTLAAQGVKDFFFITGGPMGDAIKSIVDNGVTPIDTRHEQAAAYAALAYARVTGEVGVCEGCSGPGALNLLTGVGHAWGDGVPLVALGGASPMFQNNMGSFQEVDQYLTFKPVTKWATRVPTPQRTPDMLEEAFRRAREGRPGPVYVDLPADVLYGHTDPAKAPIRRRQPHHRPLANPEDVSRAIKLLSQAERPIFVVGSGPFWSGAGPELKAFVDATGIPFFTTPQGRGIIPEDHPLSFLGMRNTAFREADVVFVIGTRFNYVIGHGAPPRFAANARFIQLDIVPEEIGQTREVEVGVVGDCKMALAQLTDEAKKVFAGRGELAWVKTLRETNAKRAEEYEKRISVDDVPIHPLRLCKEVRDFIDRDAIVVVDGMEILNFGRQTIPIYEPGHSLNSGVWGTMGVGLPFGLGAKVAKPDKQVIVLHGDGSFGQNAMEMDTLVRHKLPVVCVISNNGGWAARRGPAPGHDLLGYDGGPTRYDLMFGPIGCHAEYVTEPSQIRPALERAFGSGKPALVNVVTEPTARSTTAQFSFREPV